MLTEGRSAQDLLRRSHSSSKEPKKTYTPLHSLGDCNVVGVVLFVAFMIVAFEEIFFIFPVTSRLYQKKQNI